MTNRWKTVILIEMKLINSFSEYVLANTLAILTFTPSAIILKTSNEILHTVFQLLCDQQLFRGNIFLFMLRTFD